MHSFTVLDAIDIYFQVQKSCSFKARMQNVFGGRAPLRVRNWELPTLSRPCSRPL